MDLNAFLAHGFEKISDVIVRFTILDEEACMKSFVMKKCSGTEIFGLLPQDSTFCRPTRKGDKLHDIWRLAYIRKEKGDLEKGFSTTCLHFRQAKEKGYDV